MRDLPALVVVVLLLAALLGVLWLVLDAKTPRRVAPSSPLPRAFHRLSPQLQQLVRHTRAMSEALHDSNLEADAVVGVVFEWLAAVAEVTDDDHHYLAIRQVTASGLKTHVMALVDAPDPKRAALLLLSAFERRLYQREGGDPFQTSA